MSYLRRAGHGRLPDGRSVTWSVAEGGQGRRWRWTVATGEGSLVHAGLIELDALGRFARLELATAGGMLTLHPATDGTSAHGSVVRPDRVDPIAIPWTADAGLRIAGDPFACALLGQARGTVAIEPDLTVRAATMVDDGPITGLDDRGVPRLGDPREWPLES